MGNRSYYFVSSSVGCPPVAFGERDVFSVEELLIMLG